jgi:hypothetical protein
LAAIDELQDDAGKLSKAARQTVTTREGSTEEYKLALLQAEAADGMRSDHVPYLRTLGYAQFRTNRPSQALRTMARLDELSAQVLGYTDPVDVAYMAMNYQQLGETANAQQTLRRLQDMMLSDWWSSRENVRAALAEAKSLISLPQFDEKQAADLASIKQVAYGPHQAGWYRHDLKTWMSQWTDDALSINGGSAVADEHDVVLTRQQLKETRQLRFQGRPESIERFTIDNIEVDLSGNEATLKGQITIVFPGAFLTFQQTMKLRRTDDGWRIQQRRTWVHKWRAGREAVTFNSDVLKELDKKLVQFPKDGDLALHSKMDRDHPSRIGSGSLHRNRAGR